MTGVAIDHVASLSVQSYPAPSRVFVRVSFIPMEPPLTQADVRQEVQANKQQVLRDWAEVWREESPTVWAGMAKHGRKEVGRTEERLVGIECVRTWRSRGSLRTITRRVINLKKIY